MECGGALHSPERLFANDAPNPCGILPRVLKKLRWTLFAFGLLALWQGGASIFSMPDHEVVYETRPPFGPCTPERCFGIYVIEVGNTGSSMQSLLRVRLRDEPLSEALLQPKVRAYGKVDRPFAVSETEGVRTYRLPNVKPGERVELSFTLAAAEPESLPPWGDVLVGVDSSTGKVLPGGAASITLGRWLYRLLAVW